MSKNSPKPLPSQEELHRLFEYHEDGYLIWKYNPKLSKKWNGRYSGSRAGCSNAEGYVRIKINKQNFLLHRLIYKMHHGKVGNMEVDHIDGKPCNNKIENLRVVTSCQNSRNCNTARGESSKYMGVSWHEIRKKWRARVRVNGREMHLGLFDCEIEAAKARDAKAREIDPVHFTMNFPN